MRIVNRFAPLLHVGNWGGAFWSWEEHVLTPLDYERMLHRVGAYWDMGHSTITPREAALAKLEPFTGAHA
jgi:hypothetical protein